MEPIMRQKRGWVGLVPYRKAGDSFEFFLQKRDLHAKRNPNLFGVFGGGIENGESLEETLSRELKEELAYTPKVAVYFSRYEHATGISHLFIEEVRENFESLITIHEGQYGKFLTLNKIRKLTNVTDMTRVRITQLSDYLKSR